MNSDIDPERRAYQVSALIRCMMLAEENETSGLDWKGTTEVLALAAELMGPVIDALDENKRGRTQKVS
ncbi:hypothetical protein LX81_03824 [Palleronia aestuarii]|uniref:Uncharacterized protein n=1 Tax=Palleronia aestuarii TaxID=568105 RepID=A0A2W7N4S4_9RHOB|nr:hypothetical protein [Palleronia aestuarii]PZX11854.1 hypothetical protein LX81_03824 [Palleronia aestuarii]